MKTHLRANQAGVLSAAQADETIEFLSNVIVITGNTQLHTAGDYYQPSGTRTHAIPTSGSRFRLTIASGSATITGVIDGVTNPTFGLGAPREFLRVSGAWVEVDPPVVASGKAPFVARTSGGSVTAGDSLWMTNASAVTLSLPATASDGAQVDVVRGDALVTVIVSGGDEIVGVDRDTGETVRFTDARLLSKHEFAGFVRIGGEWRAAR